MPAPTITTLPDAPLRSETPATFVSKAEAFVAALPGFVDEANALGGYVETTAAVSGAAAATATLAAAAIVAAARYFVSQAAGEAGSIAAQFFSHPNGAGGLVYRERTGGGSTIIGYAATKAQVDSALAITDEFTVSGDVLTTEDTLSFDAPDASHVWAKVLPFDTDNPSFNWNISDTVNAGNAARPNAVMNFGWNVGPGGGPVVAGKGLFGMAFEGHYEPSPGEAYFEWHIYAGFEEDGVQRRPDSMRLDKHSTLTNGWVRLMRFNLLAFTEPKKATPFMQWGPGVFDMRTVQNAGTGEPEGGFSFSHYDSGGVPTVNLSRSGAPAIMNFALSGWAAVIMGGGMEWQAANGRFFFNDALGQGFLGNRNSRFEIVHSADIAIGRYGGEILAYLDNDNQKVGLGVEVTDPGYAVDIRGSVGFRPGHTTTQTPVANGDLVIETTSNTLLTFKYKGDDGVVRSGTLALA